MRSDGFRADEGLDTVLQSISRAHLGKKRKPETVETARANLLDRSGASPPEW